MTLKGKPIGRPWPRRSGRLLLIAHALPRLGGLPEPSYYVQCEDVKGLEYIFSSPGTVAPFEGCLAIIDCSAIGRICPEIK